jgi:hypothetical protein
MEADAESGNNADRANHYVFHSIWRFRRDPADVYAALADLAGYPRWWRQVRSVREVNASCAELVCRSVLPYSLTMQASAEIEDPITRTLRVRLDGDLVGWSQWRIGDDATATFDQDVHVANQLVRAAGRIARPLLRMNHAAMMSGGERGLRQYLAGH